MILHLPGAAPVHGVAPRAIEAVLGFLEVEVFRKHARINIHRGVFVIAGHAERAVVHDVVEVDADAETMRGFDQAEEFLLGAVAGAAAGALGMAAEIKGVPEIISDGQITAGLLRRRQPHRAVTDLGDLRHLVDHFLPGVVEVLENDLGACGEMQTGDQERYTHPPEILLAPRHHEIHLSLPKIQTFTT